MMASDDCDTVIEAVLEAPYKKEEDEQQRKRLKRTALATPAAAPAAGSGSSTSAEARRRVGAIVRAGIESAVVVKTVVETGIGVDGEVVGAEVRSAASSPRPKLGSSTQQ